MMNKIVQTLSIAALAAASGKASADAWIADSDLANAYYFVDHYDVLIEAPPERIWPHLLDQRAWMAGVDMLHVSGPRNGEGEVLRVYAGQDFLFEVVKLVPNELFVGVNYPSDIEGEHSGGGIGMFTLTPIDDRSTLVSVFMSRQFIWSQEGPNPLRETRESPEFSEARRRGWEQSFGRLRELAEGRGD